MVIIYFIFFFWRFTDNILEILKKIKVNSKMHPQENDLVVLQHRLSKWSLLLLIQQIKKGGILFKYQKGMPTDAAKSLRNN